ncbi:MAG: sensor histidine kinase [Phormidesmis sp.]
MPSKTIEADVLVVDDTAANLEVVSQVLEDSGYEVSVALGGDRALKLASMHPPDLILLAVQMPGMDGFETCRRLKSAPESWDIPVIFMTALDDTAHKVKAFDMGAVDYITKPFHEKELLVRVRTHLLQRRWSQLLEARVKERTSELEIASEKLQQSQIQMVQSEKMSALGSMLAGIAHEINNPLGFLSGSINNTTAYMQDLIEHIELYQQYYPETDEEIIDHAEDINIDFLIEDLLKMLSSMKIATERMKSMSTSLRNYSRADTDQIVPADLHEGLDGTLLLLTYRIKGDDYRPAIQVIKNYSVLPAIACFPGQLNQVFMNILANTIDMFDEMAKEKASPAYWEMTPQILTISTAIQNGMAEVRIGDNGKGMTEAVQSKIFERLFTTKAVGKGTGLGLSISHQIVVDAHGGSLTVSSQLGEGSEFCIRLPVDVDVVVE